MGALLDRTICRDELAVFDAHNSMSGLFNRYAGGRIRHFWNRQVLGMFGAIVVGYMQSPLLGFAVAGLILAGDALEIMILSWLIRQTAKSGLLPFHRRLGILASALQMAALISALGISLVFTPIPDAHFFVAALLAGIAINTALVRPYFRAGTDIKLTMLAIAGIGLRARPILDPNTIFVTSLFFEAAVAILAMTVIMFAGQVERAFERQLDMERAVSERASDLRRSKAEIAKTGIMNQRLALAAQPANDAIVFTDQNHRYTWVNQAFTRITGFTPEQAIGQFPGDLLNAAETLERLGEARKNNAAVRVEIFNRNQKGRGYWVDTSIIPILDDEGRLITSLAIERDITQAKEREAELARAREAAEAAAGPSHAFLPI